MIENNLDFEILYGNKYKRLDCITETDKKENSSKAQKKWPFASRNAQKSEATA